MEYTVWMNSYGTISISNMGEHGHYASTCLGEFDTYEEACEFAGNYGDDEEVE